MDKTNLAEIRVTTKAIARAMKVEDSGIAGIAIHPFLSSIIWHEKAIQEHGKQEDYLLTNDKVYEQYLQEFDKVVDECDLVNVYMLWRDPWKLTFMKYCGEYLSDKDYAEYLADAWVTEENPNMDANVSRKEAIKMFRKAKKDFLMTEEDLEYYRNLPQKIVVYRGVARGRIDLGLSWTDDKEKAIWFKNRWDSNGKLLKVTADKKDVIAYFNTRSEKEVLLDVFKYKDKIREVHKI